MESIVSLFDECESPVNDSVDSNNVKLYSGEFDMDRFIADSNTTLHYVNLIASDDGGNSVEVDSLLKKVCYKVSFCENCQRQSCRAFIGYTIRAKTIGGGRHLLT